MKKLFTLTLILSLALAACSKSETATGEVADKGHVAFSLGFDTQVAATRAEATYGVECAVPESDEFKLLLEGVKFDFNADYSFSKEYASVADVKDEYLYRGTYRATVSYGDITEEGYNKPAFVGVSNDFQIVPRSEVEVPITATIANALVVVEVTDNFKTYFANGYTFNVETAAGNTFSNVTAAEGENAGKPLFIAPASFKVVGSATKQANQSGAAPVVVEMENSFDNLAPRTLYRVTMDVENAGQATLKITLNDTLVEELNIDEELNPWAPTPEE